MIPAVLRRMPVDAPPEARALRGLAWTVSVPIGVPTLLTTAFLLFFVIPFALSDGSGETGPRLLQSLFAVALLIVVPWLLLVWPLNLQYKHALHGEPLRAAGLCTATIAILIAAAAVPLLAFCFFANASFPWLAAAFGLTCAAPFLFTFGNRLRKAL